MFLNRSSSEFLAREPSLTSLDRLVRDRMQDCPPTYVESQRNLPPEPSPDPPPYNDEAKTCSRCAIFTITKNVSDCLKTNKYIEVEVNFLRCTHQ